MKHVTTISVPAKAVCGEDHPNLLDSILGFLKSPIEILEMHIKKEEEEEEEEV